MRTVKKTFLKLVANVGMHSALKAVGAASSLGFHQPEEPINLKAQFDANKKN